MVDIEALCDDLEAEHEALDDVVAPLTEGEWLKPTPSAGWTIRDQIQHLALTDETATLAVADPDAFIERREGRAPIGEDAETGRSPRGIETLTEWRRARAGFVKAVRVADPACRVPWHGPPMSLASKVTARLMETWAHGQDVADALNLQRQSTGRLVHIADLGVRTRQFSYANNGRRVDENPVRVVLRGPSREEWDWGPSTADDVVSGDAEQFCLVVTRRRHLDDTDLLVHGSSAREWMLIAQTYAGPGGSGRPSPRDH